MGNPVFCNRPVPLQGLFGWSQAVFVPCREQRGKKKSLIWIKLSSMLLFVPKFPLLWLLHPRSWALSGRQCRDVLPLFTGIPRWAYTQIVSKVPAGLRSVTVEALHPSERMWYPSDTQFATHRYCHYNSALRHPAQFSLILFCITWTLCLLRYLSAYLNARHSGVQVPSEERSQQVQ